MYYQQHAERKYLYSRQINFGKFTAEGLHLYHVEPRYHRYCRDYYMHMLLTPMHVRCSPGQPRPGGAARLRTVLKNKYSRCSSRRRCSTVSLFTPLSNRICAILLAVAPFKDILATSQEDKPAAKKSRSFL